MTMNKPTDRDELRPEYKRTDFPGGLVRGQYAKRVRENEDKSSIVEFFENSPLHDPGIDLERVKDSGREVKLDPERDSMREEYDFSGAVRGVTAARYAQGAKEIEVS